MDGRSSTSGFSVPDVDTALPMRPAAVRSLHMWSCGTWPWNSCLICCLAAGVWVGPEFCRSKQLCMERRGHGISPGWNGWASLSVLPAEHLLSFQDSIQRCSDRRRPRPHPATGQQRGHPGGLQPPRLTCVIAGNTSSGATPQKFKAQAATG